MCFVNEIRQKKKKTANTLEIKLYNWKQIIEGIGISLFKTISPTRVHRRKISCSKHRPQPRESVQKKKKERKKRRIVRKNRKNRNYTLAQFPRETFRNRDNRGREREEKRDEGKWMESSPEALSRSVMARPRPSLQAGTSRFGNNHGGGRVSRPFAE